ncbi:hypothetical protein CRE_27685 [Caenorhabditis remanei]|uniref:Uncharacterized protein n=1 Tax=Caenorhabditis remanei TaxID=31234 RepID=E3MKH7_CAERE|nr:hypothetical protein CRE_27685 [Caenorhabditis remanei]
MEPGSFELLKVVGRGAYGKVYQARRKNDGQLVALKVVTKPTKPIEVKHMDDERKVLETVNSPFLCEMLHCFETNDKLYLALEFLSGGELFTLLNKKRRLDEEATKFYVAEITLALEHLHDSAVIYRDLKPDNVMLDPKGHVKLTDFGLSKSNVPRGELTSTFCGTMEYMAPEIFSQAAYGHSIDIWALGVVMYDMLTGGPPFHGNNKTELVEHIQNGKVKLPSNLSVDGKFLLKRMINRKPEKRITTDEMKKHAFFRSINWSKLESRDIDPPFKPNLINSEDVSNFDKCFTRLSPIESPTKDMNTEKPIHQENEPFANFDYNGSPIKEKVEVETKSKSNAVRKWVFEKLLICFC